MNSQSYYVGSTLSSGGQKPQKTADNREEGSKQKSAMHIRTSQSRVRGTCKTPEYPPDGVLSDLSLIGKRHIAAVSVCIYRMRQCYGSTPFLEFLLYKYPADQNVVADLCVFPFTKGGKDVVARGNKLTRALTGSSLQPEGFLEGEDRDAILVYRAAAVEGGPAPPRLQRSGRLWWALIDEICNHRTLITYPIHRSVYRLFYRNPGLVHVPGAPETPRVAYFGADARLMPLLTTLGQRTLPTVRSAGRSYGFGSFRDAVRYAGWAHAHKGTGEEGARDDGKHKQGGVARVALLMGRMRVEKHCRASPWRRGFSSSYRNCDMNPRLDVRSYGQQIALSYHLMDMATLGRRWDPRSDHYRIE